MPVLAGFENKTVSYSHLLQMANDSQIKKWFQGNDQIQSGTVKSFVKTSERSKAVLHRNFQHTEGFINSFWVCLIIFSIKQQGSYESQWPAP